VPRGTALWRDGAVRECGTTCTCGFDAGAPWPAAPLRFPAWGRARAARAPRAPRRPRRGDRRRAGRRRRGRQPGAARLAGRGAGCRAVPCRRRFRPARGPAGAAPVARRQPAVAPVARRRAHHAAGVRRRLAAGDWGAAACWNTAGAMRGVRAVEGLAPWTRDAMEQRGRAGSQNRPGGTTARPGCGRRRWCAPGWPRRASLPRRLHGRSVERRDAEWQVLGASGTVLAQAPGGGGCGARQRALLAGRIGRASGARPGQLGAATATRAACCRPTPVNGNGHLLPDVPHWSEGLAWLSGSTYGRGDADTAPRARTRLANLERLRELLPRGATLAAAVRRGPGAGLERRALRLATAAAGGRAGTRAVGQHGDGVARPDLRGAVRGVAGGAAACGAVAAGRCGWRALDVRRRAATPRRGTLGAQTFQQRLQPLRMRRLVQQRLRRRPARPARARQRAPGLGHGHVRDAPACPGAACAAGPAVMSGRPKSTTAKSYCLLRASSIAWAPLSASSACVRPASDRRARR
jgi:hypothetical protein